MINVTNIKERNIVAQTQGVDMSITEFLFSRMGTAQVDKEFRDYILKESEEKMAKIDKYQAVSFVLTYDPMVKLRGGSCIRGFELSILNLIKPPEGKSYQTMTEQEKQELRDQTEVSTCFLQVDAQLNIIAFVPEQMLEPVGE